DALPISDVDHFHIVVVIIIVFIFLQFTQLTAALLQHFNVLTGFGFHLFTLFAQLTGKLFVFLLADTALLNVFHNVAADLEGAFAVNGGNFIHRAVPLQLINNGLTARFAFVFRNQVQLVQHQPAVTLGQTGGKLVQLVGDGADVIGRADFGIEGGHIDNVQQQMRTHQVLKETGAQTGAIRGTRNKTRNIGYHKASVRFDRYHTQVWYQGGKGVIGHFRAGRGNGADKGGFTGVRQAQQTHIGQHFQFQLDVAGFTWQARLGLGGRLVGAGLFTGITQTVETTHRQHQFLAIFGQVAQSFAGIFVNGGGANRHPQHHIGTFVTGTVTAGAVFTVVGLIMTGVTE